LGVGTGGAAKVVATLCSRPFSVGGVSTLCRILGGGNSGSADNLASMLAVSKSPGNHSQRSDTLIALVAEIYTRQQR